MYKETLIILTITCLARTQYFFLKFYPPPLNRAAIHTPSSLLRPKWPNKTITYWIDMQMSKHNQLHFLKAIKDIQSTTCVKFKDVLYSQRDEWRTLDVLESFNGRCNATMGYQSDVDMTMYINKSCMKAEIIRLFMLVMGFNYEHKRSDRDCYVKIDKDNIKPECQNFFEIDSTHPENAMLLPYDFYSLLHLGENDFQNCAKDTSKKILTARHAGGDSLFGQLESLTAFDIGKINRFYSCSDRYKANDLKPFLLTPNPDKTLCYAFS